MMSLIINKNTKKETIFDSFFLGIFYKKTGAGPRRNSLQVEILAMDFYFFYKASNLAFFCFPKNGKQNYCCITNFIEGNSFISPGYFHRYDFPIDMDIYFMSTFKTNPASFIRGNPQLTEWRLLAFGFFHNATPFCFYRNHRLYILYHISHKKANLLGFLSCLVCFSFISYAVFNSNLNLSAIIAINSLFVGLPLLAETVYPNILSTVSVWPLPHATSIA